MCFTWPTLQSFISDGESQSRLPILAGIYNVVWAGVSAVSFFIGGTLLEKLGIKSMFWIPAIIHLFQWILVVRLEKNSKSLKPAEVVHEPLPAIAPSPKQKQFLRLALLANPVAYVAINTAIPLIPDLAKRFELTPMWAGIFCSLWFFVRVGAFVLFWLWPGWHYRFRWLLVAKLLLVASFLAMLRANALWVLMLAQIGFGISVGLIYYSSLFYSMDGGAAKSEHGGAHEAMIGFGTFIGAAVGVGARYFFPQIPGVSVFAVSGLLLFGFIGLVALRLRKA
jgi:predicted MFS family arabinose efflux permease